MPQPVFRVRRIYGILGFVVAAIEGAREVAESAVDKKEIQGHVYEWHGF